MQKLIVNNISKNFKKKNVLQDINIEVNTGEIVGVLGLNGAGKTTLLRILSGELKPTTGNVEVDNKPIELCKNLTEVLYVPDEIILPVHMCCLELIELFVEENSNFDKAMILKFCAKLNIDIHQSVKNLSKGNKELLQLGIMMANKPQLLILDEPLAAVDILKRKIILDLIIDLQTEGTTILISTHLISEIEYIMSRIIFIDKHTISLDLSTEEIQNQGRNIQEYLIEKIGNKWES